MSYHLIKRRREFLGGSPSTPGAFRTTAVSPSVTVAGIRGNDGGEGQDEALAADLAKFEEHKAAEEERQRLAEQVNARLQQEEEEARRKEEEVKRQAALDEERFVNCLCMCVCVCALGGGEGCFVLFFFFCLLLLPVAACFLRPVPGACSN